MNISEYIAHLQLVLAEHGDVPVKSLSACNGGLVEAQPPHVEHVRIKTSRESVVRCWHSFDDAARKGEKVVRI